MWRDNTIAFTPRGGDCRSYHSTNWPMAVVTPRQRGLSADLGRIEARSWVHSARAGLSAIGQAVSECPARAVILRGRCLHRAG